MTPCARLIAAATAVAALLPAAPAWSETRWPAVALPPDAGGYALDGEMMVDGLPMRMRGWRSPGRPALLADWFRRQLGRPLVENTLGNKLVLGKMAGEFYISVQLEPAGQGTRGVLAVSHLKAGFQRREASQAALRRLLARLPSGTRVTAQLESADGGKQARYAVLSNHHGEELNRERVIGMLRDDGLALEREAGARDGRTLWFRGAGRDAMAVICRGKDGATTIVLNMVSYREPDQ